MFKINFESEIPKALEVLSRVDQSKWPAVLVDASNKTGDYVLNKYRQQMRERLDRPTPFTLNSMFLRLAKPSQLEATVQWKDWTGSGSIPAGKYLRPEVYGGDRRQKRFEKALQSAGLMPAGFVAVPTENAPRDDYGNVPGGFITKVLSYLRANPDFMQNRQVSRLKRMGTAKLIKGSLTTIANYQETAKREAARRSRARQFFAVIKGRNNNMLPSGIYERLTGKAGSGIRRLFSFIPRATYRVIFPFYDIGSEAAKSKFPEKLNDAINKAIDGKL